MNYATFDECVIAAMENDRVTSGRGAAIHRMAGSYHFHPYD